MDTKKPEANAKQKANKAEERELPPLMTVPYDEKKDKRMHEFFANQGVFFAKPKAANNKSTVD